MRQSRAPSVPKAKGTGTTSKTTTGLAKSTATKSTGAKLSVAPKKESTPSPSTLISSTLESAIAAGPMEANDAEKLIAGITLESLQDLALSTDAVEQLPARIALEYVGDKDVSWENAQTSLRSGAQFLKDILEMEAGNYITMAGLARIESLGTLDPGCLQGKNQAARVLAVFFEACIRSAKSRMGITSEAPLPPPDEAQPAWPLLIDFKALPQHINEAVRWRKTVLIVCNSRAREVDAFLTYSGYGLIDAKWVLGETMVRKTVSIEEMQEQLRLRVVGAMKTGIPIHVAMANTAVAFKEKFCADASFPQAFFDFGRFNKVAADESDREYKKIIRPSDLPDWVGAFPGRMKDGFYIVISSDFDMESAQEHLPQALPFFEDMAILEIDPASFS